MHLSPRDRIRDLNQLLENQLLVEGLKEECAVRKVTIISEDGQHPLFDTRNGHGYPHSQSREKEKS